MPDLIPDDLPAAAEKHAVRRTFATRFVRVAVGTTPVTIDLAALINNAGGTGPAITDEAGADVDTAISATARYVWARAPSESAGNVTALRGNHASMQAGRGHVLTPGGQEEEFYATGDETDQDVTVVTLRADAAGSFLDLLWDDEL